MERTERNEETSFSVHSLESEDKLNWQPMEDGVNIPCVQKNVHLFIF